MRGYFRANNPIPVAMTAKLKVGVLVVLVVASSAAFAASANTTASIDRTASVEVVDDSSGLLALESGTSSVVSDDDGELSIDFQYGDVDGVNANSTFTVGDNSTNSYGNETSSYAFNITNQDNQAHSVDLGYSLTNPESDVDDNNIQFHVYNSTGDHLVMASEETDIEPIDLSLSETVYVVLVVDTHGLTAGDDLSGTLTISA